MGEQMALKVFSLYHVGSSKHWKGATVYWQIDIKGKIRAGKVMLYNKETGKRVKKPNFVFVNWIHSLLKLKDYKLNQCLFGEHLLYSHPEKPCAIVESEKTSLISTIYFPKFNWLATGGINNLSRKSCEPLRGRTVFLFPDAGALDLWQKKAKELSDICDFVISDLIEKNATPKQIEEGFDLADYLVDKPKEMFTTAEEIEQKTTPKQIDKSFDLADFLHDNRKEVFTTAKEIEQKSNINFSNVKKETPEKSFYSYDPEETKSKTESKVSWPIEEIENYFNSIKIPKEAIKLNAGTTIGNPLKFISSTLSLVKLHNGKEIYKTYFDSLIKLKKYFEKKLSISNID
jgi:gas vesicle protein